MRRLKLLSEIQTACRDHSARTVLFHAAVGERLGLKEVDHKALDLILRQGSATAGEIAEATGLSTGAVTGLIDRLSRGGYVTRATDPQDGRRVVVVPTLTPAMRRQIESLFAPLGNELDDALARFTNEELATILRFLETSSEVLARCGRALRGAG